MSLGDQADAAKASVDRLSTLLPPERASEVGKWRLLQTPEGAPRVEWGFDGKYFILGIGDGSADGIVAREKGAPPKWLTAVRERLPIQRPSMVHYLNIKKILALVQAAGGPPRGVPPQVLDALGLTNLTSLASVSGLDGKDWTSKMLLGMDGPPTGIFDLAGGKPLTADDLAPIPADATFAMCSRLDLDHVYRGISSIAGKIEPRAGKNWSKGSRTWKTISRSTSRKTFSKRWATRGVSIRAERRRPVGDGAHGRRACPRS